MRRGIEPESTRVERWPPGKRKHVASPSLSLLDFKVDKLSHNLKIDDKVLKETIENLYYPKSPYEFSVIGAEILGNVYEQFLGKVIRLTAGHQAKVEEKPEVKKTGGVYYTPQYIVEYIVKNTVGRLLGETVDGPVGAGLAPAQNSTVGAGFKPAPTDAWRWFKQNYFSDTTTYILGNDSKYLLGILNSRLCYVHIFKNQFRDSRRFLSMETPVYDAVADFPVVGANLVFALMLRIAW